MTFNDFFPILAAILTMGFGVGYLSRLALNMVDPDAELSAVKRYAASLLGAAVVSVAVITGPVSDSFLAMLGMSAFGALAGVLAIMDRDTAWAPDGLTIPMTVLAFVMGSVNYGTMPFFTAIIASLVVFGVGQGLWWLQCRFELIVLPPADFLAFIIPAALLGVSFSLVIFYITTASLILILRQFPYFAPIFSHQQAVDEAAIDLGFGDKPAVTFLAVAFPILFGIIFVSSVFSY